MLTTRRRSSRRWWTVVAIVVGIVAAASGHAAPAAGPDFPAFIPMPGVTPEGVAVDATGGVFVSVRENGRGVILKFDRSGEPARFADLGLGTIGGLAITANGDLYAAMATGADQGVYRVPRSGQAQLLPGSAAILFANTLAFGPRGTLYVSESYSAGIEGPYGPGGIWRVEPDGEAELWVRHPLLTGIGAVLGYPVGANGIEVYHGDVYVVNTDKGVIVRIPVFADGDAGVPEVWAKLADVPGSPMFGSAFPVMGDGLTIDVHGNVYVALVSRNAVVRISGDDRSQETIALLTPAPGFPVAPFDTPASIALGGRAGGTQALFVTNLGWMATIAPGPAWPGTGLVHLDASLPAIGEREAGADRKQQAPRR